MLTPKEKAIELILQYYQAITGKEWTHFSEAQLKFFSEDKEVQQAKQCAIIAVYEIMNVVPYYNYENRFESLEQMNSNENLFSSYWQSVKEEIINL